MFLLTVMLFLRCHFLALLWKIGFPEDDSLRKQSYTSYRPILQHFVHTPWTWTDPVFGDTAPCWQKQALDLGRTKPMLPVCSPSVDLFWSWLKYQSINSSWQVLFFLIFFCPPPHSYLQCGISHESLAPHTIRIQYPLKSRLADIFETSFQRGLLGVKFLRLYFGAFTSKCICSSLHPLCYGTLRKYPPSHFNSILFILLSFLTWISAM